MSSVPLIVSIPHSVGKAEATRRLQAGFAQAEATLSAYKLTSIETSWTGDRMIFSVGALGQMVKGHIDVDQSSVRLEAYLPWFLSIFADRAKAYLEKRGTLLLEKK